MTGKTNVHDANQWFIRDQQTIPLCGSVFRKRSGQLQKKLKFNLLSKNLFELQTDGNKRFRWQWLLCVVCFVMAKPPTFGKIDIFTPKWPSFTITIISMKCMNCMKRLEGSPDEMNHLRWSLIKDEFPISMHFYVKNVLLNF